MEIAILLALIVMNGLLSMSEFAIVSARPSRLRQLAIRGDKGAQQAIRLTRCPDRFLSTIQVGITLVGIIVGAFGGARIASDLARILEPMLGVRAASVALIIVVGATTYLTLVLGELVPKRLAIRNPEGVAARVARLMHALSIVTYPVVWLLSVSTRAVLRVLGQSGEPRSQVSEEEVRALVRQGAEAGIFARSEARMISGVFLLDDLRADAIMTPRTDVVWIDVAAQPAQIAATLQRHAHSHFPVCDANPDRVVGIISARVLAAALLTHSTVDLRSICSEPVFVPESATAAELLVRIRSTAIGFLVVLGEHGGLDGIVTTYDLAESVFGDLGSPDAIALGGEAWLTEGTMPLDELAQLLYPAALDIAGGRRFSTVAGFVLEELGRIPSVGDAVVCAGYRLTVSEMEGHRIVKVRVERILPEP